MVGKKGDKKNVLLKRNLFLPMAFHYIDWFKNVG